MQIPVLGFAAYSGTGKTTFIEKLIPLLKAKGLGIAVVKHDAHGLKFDKEGKDSWRFSHAGADYSIVNGPDQSAIFVTKSLSLEETLQMITGVDLILIEGYKTGNLDKVGINRVETGKGFTDDVHSFVALVTDDPAVWEAKENGTDLPPVFGLEDTAGLAEWIMETYIQK